MELYHLHTRENKDNKWKAKKEIIVDDKFNNRLASRINNFSTASDGKELDDIVECYNFYLGSNGYKTSDYNNLEALLGCYLDIKKVVPSLEKYALQLLKESYKIINEASIFKREMAMEQYRKDHRPDLPSRMHCIYALEESEIEKWSRLLVDGDLEVFRIETLEEPFKTSEQLIPVEHLNYSDFYSASYSYWNPHKINSNYEYLIKGKVKILEKVDEIKRK